MKILFALLLSFVGVSAHAGGFAAIALSRDGRFGEFHGANTRYEAERNAVRFCGQLSCRPVGFVENGFLVLAMNNNRSQYGTGWASDYLTARRIAMDMCGPWCYPVAVTSAFR